MVRIRELSPRLEARLAGVFYLLAVLSAVLLEGFVRGKLLYVAGLVPVASFAVVTLLLFELLSPVNRKLAWLAALFNLFGLMLEALEWHFRGANIALVFHGLYCLVVGYLVFRSAFLPRIFGALMAVGGLAWLTDLSIPLTNHLFPYNLVAGFLGEGLPMLWFLLIGVKAQDRKAQAGAEMEGHSV
jgi:Domain of unknown function (DUF4386)